ncbi:MAG: HlyC/CorC family transporter [candidate division Zixibacteria bacterium]|nr:HlyC/CorC family transporter [candidate division Zixibacteria bacterium]
MLELVLTVSLVVFVSALCSLCEAALYSVPFSHIESLAESGKSAGRILRRLRRNIDRPITAILSLNTIANTAGAAVAGAIAAKVFGSNWLGLFSGLFTLTILLVSEVIPKTVGVVYCRPVATAVARPLQVLVWLLQPLVWLCGLATRIVARRQEQQEQVSEEELLVMARLGMRKGVIDEDEALVIQNILSLGSRLVREVMTPRTVLFTLSGDLSVEEARQSANFLVHSRVPVFFKNKEDIGGIVHRHHIMTAIAEKKLDVKLESLMKPVHFVLDRTRLDRVLKMFLERGEHMFVAIDEYGGLAGVVTLEDVLEEILGKEIVDEFDQVADLRKLAQQRRRQVLQDAADHGDTRKPPPE